MDVTALPKKAFYERGSAFFPGGDAIAYSRGLGFDSIFLDLALATDRHIQAALDAGLRVWIYAGPGDWQPDTWRRTAAAIDAKLERFAHHPRMMGVKVDEEDIDRPREEKWLSGNFLAEHIALEAWMNGQAAMGRSVGYTSYPGFLYWRRVARNVRRAWGSPQLYGYRDPATPEELKARGIEWKEAFGGGYVPSLAVGWYYADPSLSRDAAEQAEYMRIVGTTGGIFWIFGSPREGRILPEVGTPLWRALRAFSPGGGGGGGVVALLALGAGWAAWRRWGRR